MNSIIPCEDCTSSHFVNRNSTLCKFKLDEASTIHFTFLDHDNTYDLKILLISGLDKDSTDVAHELTINQSTFTTGLDVDMTIGLYVMEVVANGADLQTGMLRLKMSVPVQMVRIDGVDGYTTSTDSLRYPTTANLSDAGSSVTHTFVVNNKYSYITLDMTAGEDYLYSIDIDSDYATIDSTSSNITLYGTSFVPNFSDSTEHVILTIKYNSEYYDDTTYDDIDITVRNFGSNIVNWVNFDATNYDVSYVDNSSEFIIYIDNINYLDGNMITDFLIRYNPLVMFDANYTIAFQNFDGTDLFNISPEFDNVKVYQNMIDDFSLSSKFQFSKFYISIPSDPFLINVWSNGDWSTADEPTRIGLIKDKILKRMNFLFEGYELVDATTCNSYPSEWASRLSYNVIEVIGDDATTTKEYNVDNKYITFKFTTDETASYSFTLSSDLTIHSVICDGTFSQSNFTPSSSSYTYITVMYTGTQSIYNGYITNTKN